MGGRDAVTKVPSDKLWSDRQEHLIKQGCRGNPKTAKRFFKRFLKSVIYGKWQPKLPPVFTITLITTQSDQQRD